MAEKLPWFPLYVVDFVSDGRVEAMTTREVGAYILLLCKAWHERPCGTLPNDDAILARWSRLNADDWAASRPAVLGCFTLTTDNRWAQKRMQQVYREQTELRSKRRKAGKTGAEARWQTHGKGIGKRNATALAKPCQSKSEAEGEAKTNPPQPPTGGEEATGLPAELDTPGFRDAWAVWQRYRVERRQKLTPTGTRQLLKKLASWGPERAAAAILHSVAQGWQGVHEERTNGQVQRAGGPVGSPSRVRTGLDQYANVGTTIKLGEAPSAGDGGGPRPAGNPPEPGGDRPGSAPGDPENGGW